MRKCDDCRIILEDTVQFCPKCGKAISGQAGGQTDGGLGALLASANLRRMRGELTAAAEDAEEAFRRDPNNAEAASLLAAIREDQGNLEDALVWCQLAVDLDPGVPVYRARLERIKRKMAGSNGARAAAARFFRRRWVRIAASLGVVLAVVMVIANIWGSPPAPRQKQPSVRTPEPVTISPPGERPARPPAASNGVSLSGAQPTGVLSAQPPQPSASSRQQLRTPAEIALRNSLAASDEIVASGARIDDVIADPRQAVVTVTFSLSDSVVLNKQRILNAAFHIAGAVFAANNEAQFVTARCLVSAAEGAQIAFVGDTARQTLQNMSDQPAPDQLESAFGRPWWHAYIK